MTSKDKENILKSAREKKLIRHKPDGLAIETVGIKKNLSQPGILYLEKLSFRKEENKDFRRQRRRNSVTTRSVSEEMLMGALCGEGKG